MRRGGTAHLFRAFPRRRTPPFRVGTSSDKDEEGEGRVCAVGGGGGGSAPCIYHSHIIFSWNDIYNDPKNEHHPPPPRLFRSSPHFFSLFFFEY